MKDRIREFMEYKGINAGELAVMLEVQPSNISHILHGRNKPGAAFIEKFLQVFPEVNARWLLIGSGDINDNQGGTFTGAGLSPHHIHDREEAPPAGKAGSEISEGSRVTAVKTSSGFTHEEMPASGNEIPGQVSPDPATRGISAIREEPPVTYGGKPVGMAENPPEARKNDEKPGFNLHGQEIRENKAVISRVILLFDDGTFTSYEPPLSKNLTPAVVKA